MQNNSILKHSIQWQIRGKILPKVYSSDGAICGKDSYIKAKQSVEGVAAKQQQRKSIKTILPLQISRRVGIQ